MSDADKLRDAFDQLMRYGSEVEDERIIEVIQHLVEINDDLANSRSPAMIEVRKRNAISLIEMIEGASVDW